MKVACGHRSVSPFAQSVVESTREALRKILKAGGFDEGMPRESDRPQKFEVRLIGELAKACEDPDADFTELWARGVYLGSKTRSLPRTPAVFERKIKWRLGATLIRLPNRNGGRTIRPRPTMSGRLFSSLSQRRSLALWSGGPFAKP